MPKIIISDYIWTPAYTSIIRLWFNTFDAYCNTTVHPLVAKVLSLSNPSQKQFFILHTDICNYNCLHSIYIFRLSSLLYAHVIDV